MAQMNERNPLPEQVWFDPANPGPLHEALRADYARVYAAVQRRPSLRRHIADCEVCRSISASLGTSSRPFAARKRIKLVLTAEMMHRLLALPEHFEIVHMFAANDPNIVSILVAGEGLPETDPRRESPVVGLSDVTGAAADKPS